MQVTETLSDGLKRGFTVVVPQTELSAERDRRLSEIGRTMQMPGFRPGKVPMSMVRKRFSDSITTEVVQGAVSDASGKLLEERGLRPAMQPKLEVVKAGRDTDLEFTVLLEVLPDITVPEFTDIRLDKPVATVTEEAVEQTIGRLVAARRRFTDVAETRPAAKGERLTVDFIGRIDGVAFDGGSAKDIEVVVGGEGFIPGFTEQLEGLSAGETRSVEVSFPADYQPGELAGKAAVFEVVAKALGAPVVPAVDEAFAKALGTDTVEALREQVKARIDEDYRRMSRLKVKRALLDVLAERARFTPPESLVEAEFNEIWRQVEQERAAGRPDPEDAAKDEATLKAEYQAIADRRVRLGLLVAEIGRARGVDVSGEELNQAMFAEAMKYGREAMQVVEFFRKNPEALERFRGPIFEDKVVDLILGQLTLEEKPVTAEELAADPEA